MKITWLSFFFAAALGPAHGQQTLAEYDWTKPGGVVADAVPLTIDGKAALKISNTNDTALAVQILKIQKPPITRTLYAITGEAKYENVQGDAYLEMWNFFPPAKPGGPEGQFFSRTLGLSGEMGKITGSSDWRAVKLPFDRTGSTASPTRLEVNLLLPGKGTVYLTGFKLVEYSGSSAASGLSSRAWWSEQTAGLVGGIGGAFMGCLASLLAWLAARGRARVFVLATSMCLIGVGVLLLLCGLAALCVQQPFAVWMPLLLLGFLLVIILPYRLRQFQRLYDQVEIRRMAALDAVS